MQKVEPKNRRKTQLEEAASTSTALTHVLKEHLFSINDLQGIVENTKVCMGREADNRRSQVQREKMPPVSDQKTRFLPFCSTHHHMLCTNLCSRNQLSFCAAQHWWWVRSLRLIMQGAGSGPGEVSCPTTLPHHLRKHISTLHNVYSVYIATPPPLKAH